MSHCHWPRPMPKLIETADVVSSKAQSALELPLSVEWEKVSLSASLIFATSIATRGWDDGRRRRLLNAISTSFHHPQIDGLRENVILCIGSHVKRLRPDLDLTPREVLSKPFFDWGQTATDILAEALKMVIDSSTMTASTPTHPKQSPYPQTTPSYPTLHRYWSHSRP